MPISQDHNTTVVNFVNSTTLCLYSAISALNPHHSVCLNHNHSSGTKNDADAYIEQVLDFQRILSDVQLLIDNMKIIFPQTDENLERIHASLDRLSENLITLDDILESFVKNDHHEFGNRISLIGKCTSAIAAILSELASTSQEIHNAFYMGGVNLKNASLGLSLADCEIKELKESDHWTFTEESIESLKMEPIYFIDKDGRVSKYPVALEVFAQPPTAIIKNLDNRKNIEMGPVFSALRDIRPIGDKKKRAVKDAIAKIDNICLSQIVDNLPIVKSSSIVHKVNSRYGINPRITLNITQELLSYLFGENSTIGEKAREILTRLDGFLSIELSEEIANEMSLIDNFPKLVKLLSGKGIHFYLDDSQPGISWFTYKCALKQILESNSFGKNEPFNVKGIKIDHLFFRKLLDKTDGKEIFKKFLDELKTVVGDYENKTLIIVEGVNEDNKLDALTFLTKYANDHNCPIGFQYFTKDSISLDSWISSSYQDLLDNYGDNFEFFEFPPDETKQDLIRYFGNQ